MATVVGCILLGLALIGFSSDRLARRTPDDQPPGCWPPWGPRQ